jgi:hypothetical protein
VNFAYFAIAATSTRIKRRTSCDGPLLAPFLQIVAALYPDPVDGYPPKYARDSIPKIDK